MQAMPGQAQVAVVSPFLVLVVIPTFLRPAWLCRLPGLNLDNNRKGLIIGRNQKNSRRCG